MALRPLVVIVALAGVYACAAVTGLSDYRIGDDLDGGAVGGDASGSSGATSSSGASSGTTSSSSSSSGDAAPPPPPPPPANANYVKATCAFQSRCLPLQYKTFNATDAECLDDARDDVKSSGATKENFDACAAKLDAATCNQRERDFPECEFRGTVADGAKCSGNSQCASGWCKRPNTTTDCGICMARLGESATCATSVECQSTLYCHDNTKCEKQVGPNGACSFGDGSCQDGLQCVSSKCKEGQGIGGTCTTAFGGECRSGLGCYSEKCAEKYAALGQDCGFDNDGNFVQCVHASCVNDKCAPYAVLGAACGIADATKPSCDPSTGTCVNSKCVARTPTTPTVCP